MSHKCFRILTELYPKAFSFTYLKNITPLYNHIIILLIIIIYLDVPQMFSFFDRPLLKGFFVYISNDSLWLHFTINRMIRYSDVSQMFAFLDRSQFESQSCHNSKGAHKRNKFLFLKPPLSISFYRLMFTHLRPKSHSKYIVTVWCCMRNEIHEVTQEI